MLRILTLIVISTALTACSQPRYVVRAGMDSINPTLAAPVGPLPLIADKQVSSSGPVASAKKGRDVEKSNADTASRPVKNVKQPVRKATYPDVRKGNAGVAGVVDRLPPGVIQSADDFMAAGQTMSMVPASGDQRSRLARSATRLVGIMKSFDSRSFVGHLLAICDLLPRGRTSLDWTSRDQMNQSRAAGMFRAAPGQSYPGDIVFFRCPSGCGADAADGIGVGVVVDSRDACTTFIAYRNGEVGRFDVVADELIGYCAP